MFNHKGTLFRTLFSWNFVQNFVRIMELYIKHNGITWFVWNYLHNCNLFVKYGVWVGSSILVFKKGKESIL